MEQRPRTRLSSAFSRLRLPSLLLCVLFLSLFQLSEGNRRVSIPDELDDVVDDEEDEAWKEWGRKKLPDVNFDPPPSDFSNVDLSEIQEEMMKRHTGPSFGFVKLQPGVRRSREEVPEMAMRWTKVLRTGAVEAKFTAVDVNTIMFTLERGQDTRELRDFVLSQPQAYEIKIGEHIFRRPGDPPLSEVVEKLRHAANGADGLNSPEEPDHSKEEL
ncbi:hypothetical protein Taro_009890 [Colocasia esculenta]|uniref:Mesoderm development candidate 2 n=1 Tax=Colocasia esculenta TaxID=4460 RepID=A0A843TXH4_COLES|nr:hypothetical protein [Colocasia esculenta]